MAKYITSKIDEFVSLVAEVYCVGKTVSKQELISEIVRSEFLSNPEYEEAVKYIQTKQKKK